MNAANFQFIGWELILGTAIGGFLLWIIVPGIYARIAYGDATDVEHRTTAEDKLRRSMTGVLTAIVGLSVAALSFVQVQSSLSTQRDAQLVDLFRSGVDALWSETSETGDFSGIYYLEQVLRQSDELRAPTVERLSEYIRQTALVGRPSPNFATRDAALGVLLEPGALTPDEITSLDLRCVDFTGLELPQGTSLSGAALASVVLTDANMSGASLSHTDLSRAHSDGGTTLRDTSFNHSRIVDAQLGDSDLRRATFVSSNLTGSSFEESLMVGAVFTDAVLREVSFKGAELKGSNLAGADLTYADFRGVDLSEVVVDEASLQRACFSEELVGARDVKPSARVCSVVDTLAASRVGYSSAEEADQAKNDPTQSRAITDSDSRKASVDRARRRDCKA
ncbi:MAG: pentapeptide repeat-containing protein [Pseudomonadota bacterium]